MNKLVLLLPERKHCVASVAIAEGTLAAWCARGDRLAATGPSETELLRTCFDWPGTSLPVAALSRQFDAGDAQGSAWLRADPCHIRADMVTARMLACGNLGLTDEECAAIARDLRPIFGDSGFEFEATRTERWYLRAPVDSRLPLSAGPDEVLGDDLKLHLPEGADGKRWRHLFNEAQVVLHNHPANAARARRGAVSVNGLWFWGAGVLPSFVRSRVQVVHSDRPELRGLASLAGIDSRALGTHHARPELTAAEQTGLYDLRDLRDRDLEENWLAPFADDLGKGRCEEIVVHFASGERAAVRRAHRWRWWRRVHGLRA